MQTAQIFHAKLLEFRVPRDDIDELTSKCHSLIIGTEQAMAERDASNDHICKWKADVATPNGNWDVFVLAMQLLKNLLAVDYSCINTAEVRDDQILNEIAQILSLLEGLTLTFSVEILWAACLSNVEFPCVCLVIKEAPAEKEGTVSNENGVCETSHQSSLLLLPFICLLSFRVFMLSM